MQRDSFEIQLECLTVHVKRIDTIAVPREVIAIVNRMFRPGQQPDFAAAPGAKRFVEQTQKKAPLKCPPIGGVR